LNISLRIVNCKSILYIRTLQLIYLDQIFVTLDLIKNTFISLFDIERFWVDRRIRFLGYCYLEIFFVCYFDKKIFVNWSAVVQERIKENKRAFLQQDNLNLHLKAKQNIEYIFWQLMFVAAISLILQELPASMHGDAALYQLIF